jgi:hypothetical protein
MPFETVRRWPLIAGCVVLVVIAGALAFLIAKWPFTRDAVATAIGQLVGGKVEIQKFRSTYLPFPGCVAEGITIRSTHAQGTIRKLTIQAGYASLLTGQNRVDRIRADGLYLRVLPHAQDGSSSPQSSASNSKMVVGQIIAHHSTLEIVRSGPGKEPLRFDIHELTVENAGVGRTMRYKTAIRNPEPPGEIHSSGQFGPWRSDDHGQTPLSGNYTFDHADLGMFHMVGGTLSSKGKFQGMLERIDVVGSTEIPDFETQSSGHRVPLAAQFHAVVNGTDGDVHIESAGTRIEGTTIVSDGDIAGKQGQQGKTVSLAMTSRQGRIQDLMRLFMKSTRPPMTGAIGFRAKAVVPPDSADFLKRVILDGDFGIASAQFTAPQMRQNIDILSDRARGDKDDNDPENVISNLKGQVALRNGVATFSQLSFGVPGATARLEGTYNLLNDRIDLHGTLAMQADLSQATKGVKSFLLKALDPFFKKKHAGAVVPVRIGGTYSHPSYSVDLTGKK